jgi:2-methylcitrate dehydratase PrpD
MRYFGTEFHGCPGPRLRGAVPLLRCGFDRKKRGFDQPLAISYTVAAGVSRALALDPLKAANALTLAGVSQNPLLLTRADQISHWKGFVTANGAFNRVHAAFLAMRDVTGLSKFSRDPSGSLSP